MRVILELGLTQEQMLALYGALERDFRSVEAIRADDQSAALARKRTADRDRIAKRRAAEKVACKVAETSRDKPATLSEIVARQDATSRATPGDTEDSPPSPALSPQTPLTHPPAPGDITTREGLFGGKPEPPSRRGSKLPEGWTPSDEDFEFAKAEGLNRDEIDRATAEFTDHWLSQARNNTKLDWSRTWRNRIRAISDRKGNRRSWLAPGAARAGGSGQGPVDFGSIIARRRGFDQN